MLADMDLSHVEQGGDLALQKKDDRGGAEHPRCNGGRYGEPSPVTGGMHGIPIYRPGTIEFRMNNSVLAPYVFHDVAGIS